MATVIDNRTGVELHCSEKKARVLVLLGRARYPDGAQTYMTRDMVAAGAPAPRQRTRPTKAST